MEDDTPNIIFEWPSGKKLMVNRAHVSQIETTTHVTDGYIEIELQLIAGYGDWTDATRADKPPQLERPKRSLVASRTLDG